MNASPKLHTPLVLGLALRMAGLRMYDVTVPP